ncbi:MAG: hypothetical protein KJO40_18495 [Deltaproteobacteria bacterium]|nr:hypothetical protein [Deltaproteobacteria bacterium]
MRTLGLGIVSLALSIVALETGAHADQPIITEAPASSNQLGYVTQPTGSYDEFRQRELHESSRRSRNALIGLSASAVLGTALVFPGLIRQCYLIQLNSLSGASEELRCTPAGKALVGVGWPLFVGGLTGVFISAIMFGVRKGKLRRLENRMAYEKSRAFRWDPRSSRFVF